MAAAAEAGVAAGDGDVAGRKRAAAAAAPERSRVRSVQFFSDDASAAVPNSIGRQNEIIDYQRMAERGHVGDYSQDNVYRRPDSMEVSSDRTYHSYTNRYLPRLRF